MIEQLFTGTKHQAFKEIRDLYDHQGRCIVSFLYFANMMHWRLLEPASEQAQQDTTIKYKESLTTADLLLPDGIALQLFAKQQTGKTYQNLNGTDFIPFVLDQLIAKGKKLHIGLYAVYDENIGKSQDINRQALAYIKEHRNIDAVTIQQDSYQERGAGFDRDMYAQQLEAADADTHILLVCTGTPHQEIRTQKHKTFFKEHKILVFNAGGIIDYRSGFEQRAPKRVVKARILETPRRILQHPKKNLKKLLWMFGIVRRWFGSVRG